MPIPLVLGLMTFERKMRGEKGEDSAVISLIEAGYTILKRNYRKSFGEIDVIGWDGEYLCFIEVKTRIGDDCGHPFEAITVAKQRRIARMALIFLQEENLSDVAIRFDVVAVYEEETGWRCELLKNAFDFMG